MWYYMRYFITDTHDVTMAILEEFFKAIDPNYSFEDIHVGKREYGDLFYDGQPYGEIEINHPGDGLFDEELEEMKTLVRTIEDPSKDKVLQILQSAKMTVAIHVLWQDRDTDETLTRIDPLWSWLFENRTGLLQADGEGFYDNDGLILEI